VRRHTTSDEIDGIDVENGLDAKCRGEQDSDEQPDGLIRTDGIDETFLFGRRVRVGLSSQRTLKLPCDPSAGNGTGSWVEAR
jgi:hypothetical protein